MRNLILSFFLLVAPLSGFATHIVGGSLAYEHLGGSSYRIILKVYRDCALGQAPFDDPARIKVHDGSGNFLFNRDIPFVSSTILDPFVDTCVVKPNICVEEGIYTTVVNNLPPATGGYHLFYQRCCRNGSISNITNPGQAGESFYTYIPNNMTWVTNSSPQFVNFPPVFVCQNQPIQFPHLATDKDGDSLVYSFYAPYLGCTQTQPGDPNGGIPFQCGAANAPTFPGGVATFNTVTWAGGFSTNNPLGGAGLTINSNGFLDGIPPNPGQYVMGVKCEEYRNGVLLGYIVRDFQFNVVNCPPLAGADIGPVDPCGGQTVTFTNLSDPFAVGYQWDFGDPTSTSDVSTSQNPPPWTYPGLGPYTVRLIIQPGTACADTAYEPVNFGTVNADFTAIIDSACVGVPFGFNDNSSTSPNDSIVAWLWDFGDGGTSTVQNPNHTYADSGTYSVKLIATSGLGCQDSVTKMIFAQKPPVADGRDTTTCSNNADALLNGSVLFAGGGLWQGAGMFNTNTSLPTTYTPTQQEIDSGYADVWLITTGNGLCPADSDSVRITFTPSPTVQAGDDSISVCKDTSMICFTGVITVASGGQWSTNGSGTFSPDIDSLNVCYLPDTADFSADSIVIYLTTTGNGNCNAVTDSVWIYFIDEPAVSIVANDSTCAGLPFQVNVNTSTGSGTWSTMGDGSFDNPGIPNPVYTPGPGDNSSGNVCLVFTSGNNGLCRPVTDTLCIALTAPPSAFAGGDTTACSNNACLSLTGIIVNAGGGIWSGPGTFSPSDTSLTPLYCPTQSEIDTGYTDLILVTTGNGLCPADTDSIRIVFTPSPTVDAGPDTITVCKDTLGIDLNATLTVSGGVKWTTGGDGIFTQYDTTIFTTYIPGTQDTSGTEVWIYVTTTDNQNCVAVTDSMLILFTQPPTVQITAVDTSCSNVCIALNVNTTTGSGIWTALGGGTFTPNSTSLNPTYCPSAGDVAGGSITILFQSTNNGLCRSGSDTVSIGIIPGPTADFLHDETCINDTTFYSDNSTKGFGTINKWNWYFGDGGQSTQQNPGHLFGAQTTYTTMLIVTDDYGCSDTIQKDVFIHPLPQADFLYTPGCLGDPVQFNDTSLVITGDTIVSWYWQFGDGSTSNLPDPGHIYGMDGGYPVTLIVTSNIGCVDSVIKGVTVLSPPKADFTMDRTLLKAKEEVRFTDLSTGGIVSWFWDFGDSSGTSIIQHPVYNYDQIGVYTIMLVVTDANGCRDTIYKTLEIYQPPAIPNAFTPNGNGTNDRFYIKGGPFKYYLLKIYNNWGELIFESHAQADAWEGLRDGIEQPMGVYVYVAEVVSEDGVKSEYKGDITLIR